MILFLILFMIFITLRDLLSRVSWLLKNNKILG
jgi:hypothetical protein